MRDAGVPGIRQFGDREPGARRLIDGQAACPEECRVTMGTSMRRAFRASSVRACGATTTMPSMPWAIRWSTAATTASASPASANAALTQYPAARADSSIAAMLREGPYCSAFEASTPRVRDRRVPRARAALFIR